MSAPVSTSTRSRSGAQGAAPHGGERSRIDVLTDEFCGRGMDSRTAEDLACHVTQHHPLARTLGVATLSRDIAARGVLPDAALEVATVLLAIELMDRGANYQTVVRHLKRQPISECEALSGALEASRIHRLAKAEPVREDTFFVYLTAGLTAVIVAMLLLATFVDLAQ